MQSSIALIALFVLLGLEILGTFTRRSSRLHTEALIAGLVDFHRAQCYFSSTIQIVALILFTQSQTTDLSLRMSQSDSLDGSLLYGLATNGFIPIIPALVCITRYGRQSRYILVLSLVTSILATATLGLSVAYSNIAPDTYYETYASAPNSQLSDNSCTLRQTFEDSLFPICGSWELANNSLPQKNNWIWAVWAICLVSLIICVFNLIFAKRLDHFRPTRTIYGAGVVLFVLVTSLTIAAQFYLFSIYLARDIISPTWSFGQIIAVVVWVPSVVEFLYIELGKCLVLSFSDANPNWRSWYRKRLKVQIPVSE